MPGQILMQGVKAKLLDAKLADFPRRSGPIKGFLVVRTVPEAATTPPEIRNPKSEILFLSPCV